MGFRHEEMTFQALTNAWLSGNMDLPVMLPEADDPCDV
jgi:hypothetical protein